MADLLYLLITVAFFAAAAGVVSLCDRIIGPDAEHGDPQGRGEGEPELVVAGRPGDRSPLAAGDRS